MPLRITGMNSGLDTESIITQLVKAKSVTKDNMTKAQKKLEWKTDAWKELNNKIYGLYSKTISDMRFSSSYTKKKVTASNPNAVSVMADSTASNGVQSLKVTSLAKSGYLTGAQLNGDDGKKASYTANTKLSDIKGFDGTDGFSVTVTTKGKSTDITMDKGATIGDFVKKLKDAGVNASFDANNQRFFISGTTTGTDADFALTANNEDGFKALSAMGINVLDDVTKTEYTRLKNMTASEQQAYIDAETLKRTEQAQKTIEENDKTIEKSQQLFDDFFTNAPDGFVYVKDDLDTKAKVDAAIASAESRLEALKNPTDGSEVNEEDVKAEEEKLAQLKTVSGYVNAIDNAQKSTQKANADLANDSAAIRTQVTNELNSKIEMATAALDPGAAYSSEATRIKGKDATIVLNGATFESNSNTFSINGLTITALQETEDEISLTTDNDFDGVYDTIKNFLKGYNELINEMDKLYNAASSKGYEPLTSDEKEAMTDKEVEEWEKKIKDSILRRDSTLGEISNVMRDAMSAGIMVGGKKMYLSDFGINTLGYFSAAENEKHAYHIDGDKDDSETAANEDKLKKMIASDPNTVMEFFQGLSANLYDNLTKKMSSTSMRSLYKVYNDKQMKSEYDDYTKKIKAQEDKLKAYEDKWYKKFGAMETALAKLQSKTSAISGLLGMNN